MKPLQVCLHAANGNPGDSIAHLGASYILREMYAGGWQMSWIMSEEFRLAYDELDLPSFDQAVVSCSPWVWQDCHLTDKYSILNRFKKKNPESYFFGLGVGSAYTLDHERPGELFPGSLDVEKIRGFWQNANFITCRDKLAEMIFSEVIGPERVKFLPCPSYFVADALGVAARNSQDHVLVYCELRGTQFSKIASPKLIEEAMDYQHRMIESGVDLIAMTNYDRDVIIEKYPGRKFDYIVSPQRIVDRIADYKCLTSARVHACMPARSLGLDTNIIPIDSRALTALAVGAKAVSVGLHRMESYATELRTSKDEVLNALRGLAGVSS